jgi:mannose-1-phosphate guanylyltransferase
MKIVIFAGGIGTRMWPLSRENSPKQFDQIFAGRSTIQLAWDRVAPAFGSENIYIQTTKLYQKIIQKQLPKLPKKNIFLEPARRDIAPAVFFSINRFNKMGYDGPLAIIWADHLMDRVSEFREVLKAGEKLIEQNPNRFIFTGERPRFANNNLGWIHVGKKKGEINSPPHQKLKNSKNNKFNKDKDTKVFWCGGKREYLEFKGWKYKPSKAVCDKMFKSGNYLWNPGYFITSVGFLVDCYKKLAPEIYKCVTEGKYEECPKLHFDTAIIEKVDLSSAVVLSTNMGWSDPGTLYALKEALEESSDANVTKGNVFNLGTTDSLIYNLDNKKVVTTVGLKGMVVVNTEDAIVVVHKDNVVRISELVREMKNKKLDKYL